MIAITLDKATEIAKGLSATHSKSPMALVYQALECLRSGDSNQASLYPHTFAVVMLPSNYFTLNIQAREHFAEALAGYSSSSFQECALCIRVQVELASIALAARDVEGCLNRLALAKKVVADKSKSLGSEGPFPSV